MKNKRLNVVALSILSIIFWLVSAYSAWVGYTLQTSAVRSTAQIVDWQTKTGRKRRQCPVLSFHYNGKQLTVVDKRCDRRIFASFFPPKDSQVEILIPDGNPQRATINSPLRIYLDSIVTAFFAAVLTLLIFLYPLIYKQKGSTR